jgi:hypothetical protein
MPRGSIETNEIARIDAIKELHLPTTIESTQTTRRRHRKHVTLTLWCRADFVAKTAARIPAQRSIRGCVGCRGTLQPPIFDSRSFEAGRGYCPEVRWLVLFVADPVLRVDASLFWVICHECCCSTRFLVAWRKIELDPVTQDLNIRN